MVNDGCVRARIPSSHSRFSIGAQPMMNHTHPQPGRASRRGGRASGSVLEPPHHRRFHGDGAEGDSIAACCVDEELEEEDDWTEDEESEGESERSINTGGLKWYEYALFFITGELLGSIGSILCPSLNRASPRPLQALSRARQTRHYEWKFTERSVVEGAVPKRISPHTSSADV